MTQQLKFLDLFSGIGGFRTGMIKAGNKPAGWCDIDKFARKSYQNMYDTKDEWNGKDINAVSNTDWKKINKKYGKINVICGGFPCQSFSIAGKRKGFLDKTRGTLFFQVARAAKEIKPQYLFLENVKGLLNHRHGETFKTILSTLDEIGYDAEWQVLNSKNFGVPQNRERIYIIGHLRGSRTTEIFHQSKENETNPYRVKSFYKARHQSGNIVNYNGIASTVDATSYKHNPKVAIPVLTPDRIHKKQNGRRFKNDGDTEFTINASDRQGVAITGKSNQLIVRKLTPKECWRLQGFPDSLYEKAKEVNSNSQLYKQAGNSVSVPVIEYIANRMKVLD